MPNFTNIDALYLVNLADGFTSTDPNESIVRNRLLTIANNIQSLDERNQNLMNASGGYAQGVADAEARMRRRSNVLTNPEGEDERGKSLLDQINKRVAEGNVRKVALGERALEDKPHDFNGPRKKAAETPRGPVPAVDLDLSFLGEL